MSLTKVKKDLAHAREGVIHVLESTRSLYRFQCKTHEQVFTVAVTPKTLRASVAAFGQPAEVLYDGQLTAVQWENVHNAIFHANAIVPWLEPTPQPVDPVKPPAKKAAPKKQAPAKKKAAPKAKKSPAKKAAPKAKKQAGKKRSKR